MSHVAGSEKAHGAPLGDAGVRDLKTKFGFDPEKVRCLISFKRVGSWKLESVIGLERKREVGEMSLLNSSLV